MAVKKIHVKEWILKNQEFGGRWTEEKLACLSKYLQAYMEIFTNNERARYFTTNYVDAFAGTGYIFDKRDNLTENPLLFLDEDFNAKSYIEGSTRRALSLDNPFNHYFFIEKNQKKVSELNKLSSEYPQLTDQIHILNKDANSFLIDWCSSTDWTKNRAVVFLDPFGMQVQWKTVEEIAKTKAIDLWWLFPFGVGMIRLLSKERFPSDANSQILTGTFGTDSWRIEFYNSGFQPPLFSAVEPSVHRNACPNAIGKYIIERLKTVFSDVLEEPLVLYNSKNNPMFILCFAVGNKKGAKAALNIARSIINAQKRTSKKFHSGKDT